MINSPPRFTPPPPGFSNLNFDRVAEGNPSPTKYGGLFKDWHGNTKDICWQLWNHQQQCCRVYYSRTRSAERKQIRLF